MNDDPTRAELQKELAMESLLDALYENDHDRAQNLVTLGLQEIEFSKGPSEDQATMVKTGDRQNWKTWQVIALATSALVMVSLFFPALFTPQNAMATVTRSLQNALENVGRHYVLKTKIRIGPDRTIARKADLYVKGGEQFAIHPNTFSRFPAVWIGSSYGKAWVVPPVGPVIEGNNQNLISWLARKDELPTPYLHLTTILERMRESYSLELMPNEELSTNKQSVLCRHIIGRLTGERSAQQPNQIKLWVDAETGNAIRVLAEWHLEEDELGRESLSVDFVDSLDLDDEFFTPEQHGGAKRHRIQF